jgi:hypothetical protein
MNLSKFLISASALAIAGTVGFAVAQTGQTGQTSTPNSDALTNPTTNAIGSTPSAPMNVPSALPRRMENGLCVCPQ